MAPVSNIEPVSPPMSASSMSQLASAVERLQRPSLAQRMTLVVPSLAGMAAIGGAALAAHGRPQDVLGWSVLILFLLAMAGPVLASWRYFCGFAGARIRGRSALEYRAPTKVPFSAGPSRTAVLIAIREDDPIAVFASVRVMARSLRREGGDGSDIDLFVLSATREGALSAVEEHEVNRIQAWARIEGPGLPRIRYQREPNGQGGKAGLIGAFCAARGQDYDFVIPLAADSLMSGAAMRRLVRLMEDNARIGLIRTMPYAVGADSLLARIRHFVMRLDARLGFAGLESGRGANRVWGHNAILRLAAIAQDTQSPAWETRLHPEMEGSWQVGAEGRHGPGLLSNLSAPIWLAFLTLGAAQAVRSGELGLLGFGFTGLKPAGWILGGAVIAALALPRLLSLADALLQPERRAAFGGTARLVESALLAQAAAMLLWPAEAVSATKTLLVRFLGHASRRAVRIRPISRRPPSWRKALRLQAEAVFTGLVLAVVLVLAGSGALVLVMGPLALALIASPAILLIGQSNVGTRARANGLFLTQDDTAPSRELAEYDRFRLPAKAARSRAAHRTRLRATLTATGAMRVRPQPTGSTGAVLAP